MNRQILRLAIPNIISNITIPLLGLVDLSVMGHLSSEIYIGAIALGAIVFNFVYWGFGFLRMGTSGLTAQAFGSENPKEAMLIFSRALSVGLSAGVLLILLQSPISFISFKLLDGSPEVKSLAAEYFHIRIWAAPATIGLYALTGWFLGMQNARYPMIIAILVNLLNLGFNLLFVYHFGMKSDGVALGTVLAQYIGFIFALLLFFRKYKSYLPLFRLQQMFYWPALKRFFSVNTDILIRTLLLIFTYAFFTSASAGVGNTVLAVNTLLLQFLFIFSYFIDGYANAAEALVGKYTGASNKADLHKVVKALFIWGISISIPFSLIYFIFGDNLLKVMTNNVSLLSQCAPYLFWIPLIPILTFAAFIWDGVYIGATATASMRNSMIIATLLVFLPIYYLSRGILGNHALWLAMMGFMVARGLILTVYYPHKVGRLDKVE